MPPWVFIDVSWLAHRAMYVFGKLSSPDDYPTGVIYGFLEELWRVCSDPRVNSSRVALFFDSRQSFRKQAFPEYKAKRREDKTPEELEQKAIMHRQVDKLRDEVLPACGFPCYRQTGLESDDLIAMACQSVPGGSKGAVIITADGDLWQLISWSVHWYDPARDIYYDPVSFLKDKGIDPSDWVTVKAYAGCKSDNVPGVEGVGEKTAIEFIQKMFPVKFSFRHKLLEKHGREVHRRNWPLVALPHAKTKPFKLPDAPQYNPAEFFRWAEVFGMESYLDSKRPAWEAFFRGDFTGNRQIPRKRGAANGKD